MMSNRKSIITLLGLVLLSMLLAPVTAALAETPEVN
jgi:hypothetical protein